MIDLVVGIEVTIVAVAYVIFSVLMQRKLTNVKRTYEVQEIIQAKSKELNELAKNKASQDVLAAKQKEITSLLGESMRSQFKPMFVILPIFFILFYWAFPVAYPSNPSVTVPMLGMSFNYKTYFIIVAFVLGFLFSMVLMLNDKLKLAKEKKAQAAATQQ